MKKSKLSNIVRNGIENIDDCLEIYYEKSCKKWESVEKFYLSYALDEALESSFYKKNVSQDLQNNSLDPYKRVLGYPTLNKKDYFEYGKELRLPGYKDLIAHKFHTSGTELGTPTEQPWDEWTFRRSFCESSAIALSISGVQPKSGIIIGSPGFGALAKSYIWAAEKLGLSYITDDYAFGGDSEFSNILSFAKESHVDTLIATPGGVTTFIEKVIKANIKPSELGIKKVISGVGNFLTDSHISYIIEKLDPDIIVEQGGKNEILHAPGGIRYNKKNPEKICEKGFLHYLPYVSFVTSVNVENNDILSNGSEKQDVLLMSRLTVGKPGVVSYINDAGDLGKVKKFPTKNENICRCGSSLPAFKFSGRKNGCISNRLGDTLITEEFNLALMSASKKLNIPSEAVVKTRLQIILLRTIDYNGPDILFWLIGVEKNIYERYNLHYEQLCEQFIKHWVGYNTYSSNKFKDYMVFGNGFIVDIKGMPHAGRDKPQYKLATIISYNDDEDVNEILKSHIEQNLKTKVLKKIKG